MRVLFLAPQPFFQERGTPIAVRLAVEVLAGRRGDGVDLLTYHEGQDVSVPGLKLHRIKMPRWVKGVGPGISLKKLCCDVVFLFAALRLVWRARAEQYELVHAVEESVFVAWLIRRVWGIPYLYDMDSSLALQLTEKWWFCKPLFPLLQWLERRAVQESLAVVPVCDALAAIAMRHGSKHTQVLSDISFLRHDSSGAPVVPAAAVNLREEMGVPATTRVLLYIGNLERYQGIDLLLEGFAQVAEKLPNVAVAIIGGSAQHIAAYQSRARELGIDRAVRLLGPRPIAQLNSYLPQANVLVSPRILGNNTPMKIYSYLHSGIPVLATRLSTHTQVLTDEIARLAEATPQAFGAAIADLINNSEAAEAMGARARALAEQRYTFEQFHSTLNSIYDTVGAGCAKRAAISPTVALR